MATLFTGTLSEPCSGSGKSWLASTGTIIFHLVSKSLFCSACPLAGIHLEHKSSHRLCSLRKVHPHASSRAFLSPILQPCSFQVADQPNHSQLPMEDTDLCSGHFSLQTEWTTECIAPSAAPERVSFTAVLQGDP